MEGIIHVEGYKIHCIIGKNPYERESEQEISIDLSLKIDVTEVVRTDSIVDTVDYEKVVEVCQKLAKERRYHLLETFAYEALHEIFHLFPLLYAKIKVKKRSALFLANFAAVEMEKSK